MSQTTVSGRTSPILLSNATGARAELRFSQKNRGNCPWTPVAGAVHELDDAALIGSFYELAGQIFDISGLSLADQRWLRGRHRNTSHNQKRRADLLGTCPRRLMPILDIDPGDEPEKVMWLAMILGDACGKVGLGTPVWYSSGGGKGGVHGHLEQLDHIWHLDARVFLLMVREAARLAGVPLASDLRKVYGRDGKIPVAHLDDLFWNRTPESRGYQWTLKGALRLDKEGGYLGTKAVLPTLVAELIAPDWVKLGDMASQRIDEQDRPLIPASSPKMVTMVKKASVTDAFELDLESDTSAGVAVTKKAGAKPTKKADKIWSSKYCPPGSVCFDSANNTKVKCIHCGNTRDGAWWSYRDRIFKCNRKNKCKRDFTMSDLWSAYGGVAPTCNPPPRRGSSSPINGLAVDPNEGVGLVSVPCTAYLDDRFKDWVDDPAFKLAVLHRILDPEPVFGADLVKGREQGFALHSAGVTGVVTGITLRSTIFTTTVEGVADATPCPAANGESKAKKGDRFKTIGSPNASRYGSVYGDPLRALTEARSMTGESVMIVGEGAFDSVCLAAAGYWNSVTSFNVDAMPRVLQWLVSEGFRGRVVVAAHNDESGQDAMARILKRRWPFTVVGVEFPAGVKDVADLYAERGPAAVQALVASTMVVAGTAVTAVGVTDESGLSISDDEDEETPLKFDYIERLDLVNRETLRRLKVLGYSQGGAIADCWRFSRERKNGSVSMRNKMVCERRDCLLCNTMRARSITRVLHSKWAKNLFIAEMAFTAATLDGCIDELKIIRGKRDALIVINAVSEKVSLITNEPGPGLAEIRRVSAISIVCKAYCSWGARLRNLLEANTFTHLIHKDYLLMSTHDRFIRLGLPFPTSDELRAMSKRKGRAGDLPAETGVDIDNWNEHGYASEDDAIEAAQAEEAEERTKAAPPGTLWLGCALNDTTDRDELVSISLHAPLAHELSDGARGMGARNLLNEIPLRPDVAAALADWHKRQEAEILGADENPEPHALE